MEEQHTDRKAKHRKRRNFVAKNSKHKAKKHATLKDYQRKPKYPDITEL